MTQHAIESPDVLWFAGCMEEALARNSHKGDTWKDYSPEWLLMRLKKEILELEFEMEGHKNSKRIIAEAADIANFAMMVADVVAERDGKVNVLSAILQLPQ